MRRSTSLNQLRAGTSAALARGVLETGPRLWAAILAGGFHRRVSAITRALAGVDTPIARAALDRASAILTDAVDRLAPLVPPDRICVVVDRADEAAARLALASREVAFVIQPQDLGTAPAALLALAHVRRRERHARVVVLSTTDHVSDDGVLLDTIELADVCTQLDRSTVCLLGGPAARVDSGDRWVVPGPALGKFGLRRARCFVDAPSPATARELAAAGGLLETGIAVGAADTLWAQARMALPALASRVSRGEHVDELRSAFTSHAPASFADAVLSRARRLGVIPLRGCQWTCLDSAARVIASVEADERARASVVHAEHTRAA